MKKELKFFLLGVLSTIVAAGIIFGVICLIEFINVKTRNHNNSSNGNQESRVVIDGYRYTEIIESKESTIVCSVLNNIKQYYNNYLLTNSNELYEFNSTQKFSDTNENCHKITDIKIKKIMDNNYYLSEDNKLYHFNWENDNKPILKEVENYGSTNKIIVDILSSDDIVSARQIKNEWKDDKAIYIYEVLKTDGKVYEYTISTKDNYNSNTGNSTTTVRLEDEKLKLEIPGEKIKKYYGEDEYNRASAITDKGIYLAKVKNAECKDYADIECEYELVKDDYFSKKLSDISINNYIEVEDNWANLYYYNKEGKHIQLTKSKDGEV